MSDSEFDLNLPLKCYDFCVNNSQDLPLDPSNIRVASPDFAILLDHTIGVIWKLLKKDANVASLDQFHLIWALKFLEGIKPKRGHVSKDVDLLKLLLRKLIVEKYAGSDVEKPKPLEKSVKMTRGKEVSSENVKKNEETGLEKSDVSDMNAGFVHENDGTLEDSMDMYSFSDDIWYANRKFSVVEDESNKTQGIGGFISNIFGFFK